MGLFYLAVLIAAIPFIILFAIFDSAHLWPTWISIPSYITYKYWFWAIVLVLAAAIIGNFLFKFSESEKYKDKKIGTILGSGSAISFVVAVIGYPVFLIFQYFKWNWFVENGSFNAGKGLIFTHDVFFKDGYPKAWIDWDNFPIKQQMKFVPLEDIVTGKAHIDNSLNFHIWVGAIILFISLAIMLTIIFYSLKAILKKD